MPRPVLIDCDPGLDDAVALLAALSSRDLQVCGITTVAGNVRAELTARNARTVRAIAGAEGRVPVYGGANTPLLRGQVTAEDFHGTSGLGDLPVPTPQQGLSRTHAVTAIIREARAKRRRKLTLIATGPLTNLALAFRLAPEIVDSLDEIIIMGGAESEGGNITPYAEFNIFADPHAAAIVFNSAASIRVLSLDATHQVRAMEAEVAAIRNRGTRVADFAADFLLASNALEQRATGNGAAPLHDPSTVLAAIQPDLFTYSRASVDVVTAPGKTFGQTQRVSDPSGNVLWAEQADRDGCFQLLGDLLEQGQ